MPDIRVWQLGTTEPCIVEIYSNQGNMILNEILQCVQAASAATFMRSRINHLPGLIVFSLPPVTSFAIVLDQTDYETDTRCYSC